MKILVIGCSPSTPKEVFKELIDKVRSDNIEIECVHKITDVNISTVDEIDKIINLNQDLPKVDDLKLLMSHIKIPIIDKSKHNRKGHQRPYKFHP